MVRIIAMAAILLLCLPLAAAGDGTLSVTVRPRVCRVPCQIRVVVRREPHRSDRLLQVEADSLAHYRSSTFELEGDSGPAVHRVVFRSLPAGRYLVRTSLGRADGGVARVDERIRILGSTR